MALEGFCEVFVTSSFLEFFMHEPTPVREVLLPSRCSEVEIQSKYNPYLDLYCTQSDGPYTLYFGINTGQYFGYFGSPGTCQALKVQAPLQLSFSISCQVQSFKVPYFGAPRLCRCSAEPKQTTCTSNYVKCLHLNLLS